jgi:hypothetical protein
MPIAVNFGGASHGRLTIEVGGYAQRVGATNISDANWLTVKVTVDVGSFSGTYGASFFTDDFVSFESQLTEMHQSLRGGAKFETPEGQLELQLACSALGNITLKGIARDHPGIGSTLSFSITFDQTQLGSSLTQMRQVLSEYPPRQV